MKKKSWYGDTRLFVASALVVAAVTLPFEAAAGWRTQHASACQVIEHDDLPYWLGNANYKQAVSLPGGGGQDPNPLRLMCPVSDDSDFSKQNATAGATFYHAAQSWSTQWNACVSYENAVGGACSSTNYVSGTGISTATIAVGATLSPWTTRAHYAYLNVALASRFMANDPPNTFQGYYFQN